MIMKLSWLTFEMLEEQYPKCYGKKYGNGVSMPNADDSMRVIHNKDSLMKYQDEIMVRFGDVIIELHSEEEIWFDRVKIKDLKFMEDKNKFCESKARAMDRWSKQGFNTD